MPPKKRTRLTSCKGEKSAKLSKEETAAKKKAASERARSIRKAKRTVEAPVAVPLLSFDVELTAMYGAFVHWDDAAAALGSISGNNLETSSAILYTGDDRDEGHEGIASTNSAIRLKYKMTTLSVRRRQGTSSVYGGLLRETELMVVVSYGRPGLHRR